MTSSRDLEMLMRYGAWANATLFAALADAPADVIDAPRPGRPRGMIGTLAHILVVDQIWKAHLEGREHGFQSRNLDRAPPLADLRIAQSSLDRWYVDYAEDLPESTLNEVVRFAFVDGGAGALRRGDMLLHVANHKTYHRGYVADMLYESGLQPPTIDLTVFLRDVGSADGA